MRRVLNQLKPVVQRSAGWFNSSAPLRLMVSAVIGLPAALLALIWKTRPKSWQDLLFAVALCLAIAFLVIEFRDDTVIVESIDVPKELEAQGYTGRVIAARMVSEIGRMSGAIRWVEPRAATVMLGAPTVADFEVPGLGFSFSALVSRIRGLLGWPRDRIEGEIIKVDGGFRLDLRFNGRPLKVKTGANYLGDGIGSLVSHGAQAILGETQPFFLAAYFDSIGRNQEARVKIDEILARSEGNKGEKRFKRLRAPALALKGAMDQDIALEHPPPAGAEDDRFANARLAFQKARDEAKSHGPKEFLVPEVRLATLMQLEGKKSDAEGRFEELLNVNLKQRSYILRAWGDALRAVAKEANDKATKRSSLIEADARYRHAGEINPGDVTIFLNWALMLDDLGRLARGEGMIDEARKHFADAITHYQRAVALDSNYEWPEKNWGGALNQLGRLARDEGKVDDARERFTDAITHYQRAVALDSNDAWPENDWGSALNQLGELARDEGKIDEARKHFADAVIHFQRAIALDSNNAWSENVLGIVLDTLGRLAREERKNDEAREHFTDAITHYRRAITLDPNDAWPENNWGSALHSLAQIAQDERKIDEAREHFTGAITHYERAAALNDREASYLDNLGSSLSLLADLAEASDDAESAAAMRKRAEEAWASARTLREDTP